ncbi:MAG: phosphate signaling complex protein PhoU [Oscillospiraceae bacterium]|jgi:phosphate transport system protein|nr:phosphate signaling complex protein PhoU [Oscillospiraceae bacterium]
MNKKLHNQIKDLINCLYEMGCLVKKTFKKTLQAYKNIDIDLAKEIIVVDTVINSCSNSAESKCLKILGLYHPTASDFRSVASCLKILSDIERIGDQCADICEIISMNNIEQNLECFNKVAEMLEFVYNMFQRTCEAFLNVNIDEAKEICYSDDEVDDMFASVVFNSSVVMSKESSKIRMGADLMFVAKYAERIGDHCTNISEWVIYLVTGVHPNLN